MSRDLNATTKTASKASVVRPIYLARLDIASGEVLAASAPFSVFHDWDDDGSDEEFLGVGEFGKVNQVEEGGELRPYTLQLTLSHVPPENLSMALGEDYQGRDCRLWLALLDENHVVTGAPYLLFRGGLDTMDITLGEQGEISVTAHSRLRDWERPRIRRFTNEDQQAVYPGDKGFEFVPQMVEKELVWGQG